jgi:hypothetical protein
MKSSSRRSQHQTQHCACFVLRLTETQHAVASTAAAVAAAAAVGAAPHPP